MCRGLNKMTLEVSLPTLGSMILLQGDIGKGGAFSRQKTASPQTLKPTEIVICQDFQAMQLRISSQLGHFEWMRTVKETLLPETPLQTIPIEKGAASVLFPPFLHEACCCQGRRTHWDLQKIRQCFLFLLSRTQLWHISNSAWIRTPGFRPLLMTGLRKHLDQCALCRTPPPVHPPGVSQW